MSELFRGAKVLVTVFEGAAIVEEQGVALSVTPSDVQVRMATGQIVTAPRTQVQLRFPLTASPEGRFEDSVRKALDPDDAAKVMKFFKGYLDAT